MSFYAPSGSRCVSPTVNGVRFDTAHRKKASANIFENINRNVLVKLFEKAGDTKAVERAKLILTHYQDPESISKALMTLKTDKKDRLLLITGLTRQSFIFRWGLCGKRAGARTEREAVLVHPDAGGCSSDAELEVVFLNHVCIVWTHREVTELWVEKCRVSVDASGHLENIWNIGLNSGCD